MRIEQSELLDPSWYRRAYPDVADSELDPVRHYLHHGWREGRDPGPNFSTAAYLKANPDVARAGLNPLVHYLEHGRDEGRASPGSRVRTASRPLFSTSFGDPARVALLPIPSDSELAWRRASRMTERVVEVGRRAPCNAGIFSNREQARQFDMACRWLAFLHGAGPAPGVDGLNATQSAGFASPIDSWFAHQGLLRSRWKVTSPRAVRALQWDGRGIVMLNEALVSNQLEPCDANLIDGMAPILFVVASPDGDIEGWRLLEFPSLCRGGLHYPELIALSDHAVDPFDQSRSLFKRLVPILADRLQPLVANIQVDGCDSDGTEPLFSLEVRQLLSRMRVALRYEPHKSEVGDQTHVDLGLDIDPSGCRPGQTTLHILPVMIPTISALVSTVEPVSSIRRPGTAPVLVPSDDPARPVTMLRPAHLSYCVTNGEQAVSPFPTLSEAPEPAACELPPLAIRIPPSRELSEAEWLTPVAAPALPIREATETVEWLIWPARWTEQALIESLEALAAQIETPPMAILFVGRTSPGVHRLARRLFKGSVRTASAVPQATAMLAYPITGMLGAETMLHDRRLVAHLCGIMTISDVASASAIMVEIERRGKGWQVTPADIGELINFAGDPLPSALALATAPLLWRTIFPVAHPPRDLWLARTAMIKDRSNQPAHVASAHLCSALVTASYHASRPSIKAEITLPRSAANNAMSVSRWVG